jgi:hypothetical protein
MRSVQNLYNLLGVPLKITFGLALFCSLTKQLATFLNVSGG